jgi:hypothetical protein
MRKSKYFSPPPIFDNNTQLSLLLTSDHEQKIFKYRFYLFWLIHMTLDQEKKKGGVWIYGDCHPPSPPPPNNKGMLDNGQSYFAKEF